MPKTTPTSQRRNLQSIHFAWELERLSCVSCLHPQSKYTPKPAASKHQTKPLRLPRLPVPGNKFQPTGIEALRIGALKATGTKEGIEKPLGHRKAPGIEITYTNIYKTVRIEIDPASTMVAMVTTGCSPTDVLQHHPPMLYP